ncbi:MAG: short-chain dehydrogenase [Gordonia sp.]|jgi:NADP-dependent 3-hydroxy acid dehydrogenase YdfG|uniref:SDR family oxidoreductase n=1 Tax=Gordonia sp. (in: high G+C Gram-positive bacteria) TaxID=84139 RepID=UPI000C3C1523|nr:SDR family oxidoreductase [Gordonia sp. (in: high G+C Gram-positive bacteria)]MAU82244.1 short-chain dehydrogenase [Gordonia sp. (in: high G+C Gram-positive bacteria)]
MAVRDLLRRGPDHGEVRAALRGKVIAITGGACGIGFETATQLFEAGAVVALGDIDDDAVGKAAADLGVEGFGVDVTDRSSFEEFLDAVESAVGPIDVLINNAGIMPVGDFLSYDEALIRRTYDIDVIGVITGTQLAARRMVARGRGQIVNIASVAGRLPTPGLTIYNGAKAAVIEFSEAVDAELEKTGVRVSTVLPTFTRTGLISGLHTNSMVRAIEPKDVAAQVLAIIARPRVRLTAPRSMAWTHANALFPQRMKRASRRMTKLDSMFLDYDHEQRAAYSKRIGSR